jgi:hypothetical protein
MGKLKSSASTTTTTTTTKKHWGNYKEQKAHDRHWSQHDTVTVAEQNMIDDLLA